MQPAAGLYTAAGLFPPWLTNLSQQLATDSFGLTTAFVPNVLDPPRSWGRGGEWGGRKPIDIIHIIMITIVIILPVATVGYCGPKCLCFVSLCFVGLYSFVLVCFVWFCFLLCRLILYYVVLCCFVLVWYDVLSVVLVCSVLFYFVLCWYVLVPGRPARLRNLRRAAPPVSGT